MPTTVRHAKRQEAEIAMLKQLPEHASLPRYLRDGRNEQGQRFVDYEAVPGQTVRQFQRAGGSVDRSAWLNAAFSLLELIALLHERSPPVFHGDISAMNVILGPALRAGLIDFGIARSRALPFTLRLSSRLSVAAPRYLSPEQGRSDFWGRASDVFQVGLVLLELHSGRPVNREKSTAAAIRRVREDPDFAMNELDNHPEPHLAILSHMLAGNPARRLNASSLLAMLRDHCHHI